MTTTTAPAAGDLAQMRKRLNQAARQRGWQLCSRCGSDPQAPCLRCHTQREEIALLDARGLTLEAIAAQTRLTVERVSVIVEQEREKASGADDLAADLLREDLAAAAEQHLRRLRRLTASERDLLAQRVADKAIRLLRNDPDLGRPQACRKRAERLLKPLGWTRRSADNVLAGTHLPNRPLRNALLALRARVLAVPHTATDSQVLTDAGLTGSQIADRAGFNGDSHLDRCLGLRPDASTTKKVLGRRGKERVYRVGGAYRTAIALDAAARVADAVAIPHNEIPGL